jgi:hypothetical protein
MIPIVGADIEVYEPIVLVNAKCMCDPSNTPVTLIAGIKWACGKCGRIYAVARCQFDLRTGRPPAASVVKMGYKREVSDGRGDLRPAVVVDREAERLRGSADKIEHNADAGADSA